MEGMNECVFDTASPQIRGETGQKGMGSHFSQTSESSPRYASSGLKMGREKMEEGSELHQVQKELELIRLQLQIIVELLTEISESAQKK